MMRYLYIFLLIALFFTSCEDDKVIVPEEEKDTQDVTYLLYMVGQNDLSSFLTENINDLKKGLEKTDINAKILVYADISNKPELYLIAKDKTGTVTKETVKTYSDRYSVDPENMREVINYVFTTYPAGRRAITFSSHADGSLYTPDTVYKRSFGYEGAAGYGMNITDIRETLEGCPKMDLIMFDACMMASVETAYELKNYTRYFLASPNSVPGEGFPYDKVLPDILKMNAEGLSQAAQGYYNYFHRNSIKWDDFVSISLTDVTKLDSLAIYMDSLFLDEDVRERAAKVNRNQLQMFEQGYALYDYGHWADSVGKGCKYLPKVKEHLDNAVIYKVHSDYASTDDYGYNMLIPVKDETFCGLNTYVPPYRNNLAEVAMRKFFTRLKWYREAGFFRVPYYNTYASKE